MKHRDRRSHWARHYQDDFDFEDIQEYRGCYESSIEEGLWGDGSVPWFLLEDRHKLPPEPRAHVGGQRRRRGIHN